MRTRKRRRIVWRSSGHILFVSSFDLPVSVLREDGRCREAGFNAVRSIVEVFLPRHVDLRPARGTDTHDSARADTFDDEVGFKTVDTILPLKSKNGIIKIYSILITC